MQLHDYLKPIAAALREAPKAEHRAEELMPQRTGDSEKKFELAIRGGKIKFAEPEKIKEAIRYAMIKIGLRAENFPKEEEKILLIQHIIEHYGNHTIEEIRIAFDMAITGKLGIDANCYENFSCLYFSKIMSAYRRWAASEYETILNENVTQDYETKIYSDEENENKMREVANVNYKLFINGKSDINPHIAGILLKDGLMKEKESVEDVFLRMKKKGYEQLYKKS